MFRTDDVMNLIEEGIMSIDGYISDKPDQNGCCELYTVDTNSNNNIIEAEFTTYVHGEESHDKYKITVELIE